MHRRHPVKQASLLLRRSEMKLLNRIFLITPVRHSQTHVVPALTFLFVVIVRNDSETCHLFPPTQA